MLNADTNLRKRIVKNLYYKPGPYDFKEEHSVCYLDHFNCVLVGTKF